MGFVKPKMTLSEEKKKNKKPLSASKCGCGSSCCLAEHRRAGAARTWMAPGRWHRIGLEPGMMEQAELEEDRSAELGFQLWQEQGDHRDPSPA